MPYVNCWQCSKIFYTKPAHLKVGWGRFCSIKCKNIGFQKRIKVYCATCNNGVIKTPSRLIHSKSGKFFCSKSCQTIWRNKEYSGKKHKGWKGGYSTYRDILLKNKVYPKCAFCCIEDIHVLVAHHIDKNHFNNSLKNLVWLCHNCHYLVHHDSVEERKFMEALV